MAAIEIDNLLDILQQKENDITVNDDTKEIIKILSAIKISKQQILRSYAQLSELPNPSLINKGNIYYVEAENGLYVSTGAAWLKIESTSLASFNVISGAPSGNGGLTYDNTTGEFIFNPADLSNKLELLDLSVCTNTASGNGNLSYNNHTGEFVFTPADLSDYPVTGALNNFICLTDLSICTNTASGNGGLTYDNTTGEFAFAPADIDSYFTNGNICNLYMTGTLCGPSTFTIDPAAHGDNTGTVVIAGNLQVDGVTTTVNSCTLEVVDKNIVLACGSVNAATSDGAGITADLGSDGTATILYNATNDDWNFNKKISVTGNIEATGTIISNGTKLGLGDNQKEFVASGDISAGDVVSVKNDGTVEKVTFSGTSGLSASATDSNSLATDPYFAANVIYDQVTDRYVVFRSNGGALYAVVAQATSTGFTLGIELQFYMYAGSINITNELSVTIDKNANKIICAWVGQGQNYADGGLRVAAFEIDPATNTITMGNIAADTDQPNINNVSIGYDTDTGKFLIICNYSTDVRCYAGYVDGQNIVLGTRQSLTVSGGPTWFGIAYDQTAQRFFIGHDANGRVAAVAQINGDNSITFGAWTTIPNESTPGNPYYKTSEGKIYLPYISTNYKASLGEVTIDNVANTLTFNTVELTATPDVLKVGMVYLELIDQFYFYYKKFNWAGGEEYIADVVFNNGTPSLANSIETSNMFNYTTGEQYKATVGIDRVVGVYGTGPAYLTYSTFASINSNASSWIGIAAEDIADTATGLIDLSGAINRSQAGLVKDTVYYVNQLGSLTTTPTTFGMIGKAISTTDLQIFGNAVIELSKAIDVDFTTNTPTTTSGLVLTSDGDSTYSFQQPVGTTQIADLTDVDFTTNTPTTTSGLVLTSDGDSTYSFQKVIGNNQKEFVATGTIATGDVVALRSDGTVELVGALIPSSEASYDSALQPYYSNNEYSFDSAYDSSNNKIFIATTSGINAEIVISIGTISGSTITFGSGILTGINANYVSISTIPTSGEPRFKIAYDQTTSQIILVVLQENSPNYNLLGYVGNISGNSITWSTSANYQDSVPMHITDLVVLPGKSQVVVNWVRINQNLGTCDSCYTNRYFAMVYNIGANSITGGTATIFGADQSYLVSHNKSVYIPTVSWSTWGTDASIAIFYGEANAGSSDAQAIRYIMCSVNSNGDIIDRGFSGVDYTVGLPGNTIARLDENSVAAHYDSNSQNLVVAITKAYNTNETIIYASEIPIIQTAIGFSAGLTLTDITNRTDALFFTDTTNNLLKFAYSDSDTGIQYVSTITIGVNTGSGIPITQSDIVSLSQTGLSKGMQANVFNNDYIFTHLGLGSNSTNVGSTVYSLSYTNQNADSWIGIAAENIADTATGLIDLPGAINRSQTGLTTDSIYYVDATGSLTTTPTIYGKIGRAYSATELQIFGNPASAAEKTVHVSEFTGASQSIDLDVADAFKSDLSSDTSYSFSTATPSNILLHKNILISNTTKTAFEVKNPEITSQASVDTFLANFAQHPDTWDPNHIKVKPDGTKLWIKNKVTAHTLPALYQYSMSTPWDLSTLTFDGTNSEGTVHNKQIYKFDFSSDWSVVVIYRYDQSAFAGDIWFYPGSWDASSATPFDMTNNIDPQDTNQGNDSLFWNTNSVFKFGTAGENVSGSTYYNVWNAMRSDFKYAFNSDCTKIITNTTAMGSTQWGIYELDLSGLSTYGQTSTSPVSIVSEVSTIDASVLGSDFYNYYMRPQSISPDGKTIFWASEWGYISGQWKLDIAYDLTSINLSRSFISIDSSDRSTDIISVAYSQDGTKAILMDRNENLVSYNSGGQFLASYPANAKLSADMPTSYGYGKKSLIEITSLDGGSNYYINPKVQNV